nr:hypothetical protein [Providencia rettgeri]
MTALWSKLKAGVLMALVFLGALFGVWRAGKRSGSKEAKAERLTEDLTQMAEKSKQIKEVQDEVDKMSDADVNARLESKWMRKKD